MAQLKPGGRMVIPVGSPFMTQQLMLVTRKGEDVITQALFPVRFVPFTRSDTFRNSCFRPLISLGLVSASVIGFQLALMGYFSNTQWSHFAFMVISVALLGFGASGTWITLFRSTMMAHVQPVIAGAMLLSGVFMILCIPWFNGSRCGWMRCGCLPTPDNGRYLPPLTWCCFCLFFSAGWPSV
jgi:hypothetical protein